MTDVSAAAPLVFKPKASRPAPADQVGMIGWMRRNLFRDVSNTLMTLVGAWLLFEAISAILSWAIFNASWSAANRRECLDTVGRAGACWPGVGAWMTNLIYGLYPKDQIWRINLGFLTLALWVMPLWLPRVTSKVGIGLSAVLLFPMLASYWFLGGEKGFLWWLVVSAGLGAFAWVWATTLSEMLTGRPIGQALIGAMGRDDADDATQRRIVQILAALLFVGALAVTSQWELREVRTTQWGGLFLTLVLSGFGITFSLPAGIMLALGRRSKMPVVSMLCTAFIELFRSVPLITVLFMANTMLPLFMPEGTEVNHLLRAIVAVCLFAAAYMAEVVRGGLQAMPRGQYEAAASLGLGYWQTTQLIIMPQALKIMIPTIVGNFIGLLKDTTLVSIIGLKDLMSMARAVGEDGQWLGLFFEPFFFVALIYFVICFAMSSYSMALERKLGKGRDRG